MNEAYSYFVIFCNKISRNRTWGTCKNSKISYNN